MKKIYLLKFISALFLFSFTNVFANTIIINSEFTSPVLETTDTVFKFTGKLNEIFSGNIPEPERGEVIGYLPEGLVYDNSRGLISGIARKAGSFQFKLLSNTRETVINIFIDKGDLSIEHYFYNLTAKIIRGKLNETFNNLSSFTNEGTELVYTSNDSNIVSVNDTILSFNNYGLATITAISVEDDQYYASQPITFIIDVIDPLDESKSYQGLGVFEKVTNENQFTEGYYVLVVNEKAMTSKLNPLQQLSAENISILNNKIVNPSREIVWRIKDLYEDDFFLYNENIERYLYNEYSEANFVTKQIANNGYSLWKVDDKNNGLGINNLYSSTKIAYNTISNVFKIVNDYDADNLPIQIYKYNTSNLAVNDIKLSKEIKLIKDNNRVRISSKVKIETIEVFDSSGRKILEQNWKSKNENSLEIKQKGVLLFRIKTSDGYVQNLKYIN